MTEQLKGFRGTDYITVRREDVERLKAFMEKPFPNTETAPLLRETYQRLSAALSAEPVGLDELQSYMSGDDGKELARAYLNRQVHRNGSQITHLAGKVWVLNTDATEAIQTALSPLPVSGDKLREAAQAVLDRWETPDWKDAEPTAHVMARLRQALKDTGQ